MSATPPTQQASAHPFATVLNVLDRFTKFLSTNNGRDKLNKLLQYGSKMAAHHLESSPPSPSQSPSPPPSVNNKEWIERLTRFEGGVAAGRKVSRFYRFLPGYVSLVRFIQKCISSASRPSMTLDLVLEALDVAQKVSVANYFLLDTCSWGAKLGVLSSTRLTSGSTSGASGDALLLGGVVSHVFNNERLASYNYHANWQWFVSLVLVLATTMVSLVRDFERETVLLGELNELEKRRAEATFKSVQSNSSRKPDEQQEQQEQQHQGDNDDDAGRETEDHQEKRIAQVRVELKKLYSGRGVQVRSFVANACDLGIATSLVGWISLSKGSVGLLGCISALVAAYDVW